VVKNEVTQKEKLKHTITIMSLQRVSTVRFITDNGTPTAADGDDSGIGSTRPTRPARTTSVQTNDIDEILLRFRIRDELFCPAGSKFNGDTFKRKSDEYRAKLQLAEKHRVHVGGLTTPQGGGINVTINASSTLKGLFFFEGPISGRKFSVETAAAAEVMRQAGYKEFKMDHYSDIAQLPKAEVARNDNTNDEVADPTTAPVPSQVKLPDFTAFGGNFPPLYTKERGEKYAVSLLRAWEDRVIIDNVVYSPYKAWTNKEVLKQHGFNDDFTNKSKAYIAAKMVCSNNDPATAHTSTTLAKKATGWSGKGNRTWFDVAVSIANNTYVASS
jgi:hypothetical protein